jgi:hypothetical protein
MRLDHPLGLVALAAVAVLVLLYLYDRRRRTIPVGTLFLWQQIASAPRERERFRPDLLFFAQLALLLALIGAYVRPVLEGPSAPPTGAPLVVVLDVSASMQAVESDGSRFEAARRRAGARIAEVAAIDDVLLITAGARPRVALPWTSDRASIRAALEALAPSDTPTDLGPAIELARGSRPSTPAPPSRSSPICRRRRAVHPEARARLDYVQIGRTDDNVASRGSPSPPRRSTVRPTRRRPSTCATTPHHARSGAGGPRRGCRGPPRPHDRAAATEHVLLTRPPQAARSSSASSSTTRSPSTTSPPP